MITIILITAIFLIVNAIPIRKNLVWAVAFVTPSFSFLS